MAIYEERESYACSRASGIGGTDCAAILNLSPWKKPIEVYAGKINPQEHPELDKECLYWGTALEPIVRDRYAQRFGVEIVAPDDLARIFPRSRPWNESTLVIGKEDWMLGAPDGWIETSRNGVEVKCASRKSEEWGDEGSDAVPAHYLCQVAWYMAVCDAPAWNFAVLFSGNKLAQYRVVRDLDLERDLIEAASAFWHDNVLKRVEPEIDESESYGRYLARKFSLNTGQIIKEPSQEFIDLTAAMKTANEEKEAAESRERLANNKLRALLGSAQKAITPLGSIGWVRPKEHMVLDEPATIAELARLYDDARSVDAASSQDIISSHYSPKQNEAYLRAWWSKKQSFQSTFVADGEF